MTDGEQARTGVTLGSVARATNGKLTGDERARVLDVTHDSRQAGEGGLFVAVRGTTADANSYVAQVMEQGAIGIISERSCPENFKEAWIEVEDARRALASASAEVHGHPSRELRLVGVTGTNGKTTIAYLVRALMEAAGEKVAMTSTVEYRIGDEARKAERTTPEASDMQRFLRRAVEAGCHTAVMECSSHAIDLHRCDALHFSVAAFTNLTRDHLDYHVTMEAYFAAKRRLFDGSLGERPRASVINIDDAHGEQLARDLLNAKANVMRYSLQADAEVTARDVKLSLEGTSFRLGTPAEGREIISPLVGRPHVSNILAAVGCGLALGYDLDVIARAIKICAGAPGRFERVAHDGNFTVVVDYAHTDDALINVLRTARSVAPQGRVITVFGCGGDRDRSKRAPMGEAAASLSDVVILTSDNPRTEDPEQILADVETGLRASGKPYQKIADRRRAIHEAIAEASEKDLVLIAGKGHEDYQLIGREVFHFDDREVAREALVARSR